MSMYLTSTDPEVMRIVRANADGVADLRARALAWAAERGFESVMMNGFLGTTFVAGLPGIPDGFGKWTQPKRGASTPYRTNAAEHQAMAQLQHKAEPVPGLPDAVHSVASADGSRYLMYPTPFVADGQAWIGFSHQVDPKEQEPFGPQWTECLASAFHAAQEARRNAASESAAR